MSGATTSGEYEGEAGDSPSGAGVDSAKRRPEFSEKLMRDLTAHRTATAINDTTETNAIKKLFGSHANKLAISSTKSMHGHPLGAGGGIEAVACIKAMRESWVPPTAGLDEPGEGCDLDYVPNVGREQRVTYAMSNSFAFGGLNAVLVFGPPPA